MVEDAKFLESLSVKTWLDGLAVSTDKFSTKYQWTHMLDVFCKWTGKSPDMLIEQRKTDLKSDDPRVKHQLELEVKRFLNVLATERGLGTGSQKTYFTAIRSFFKRNYYALEFFRGDAPQWEAVSPGTRAATKDDIRLMLEVSNPRIRALILFLKDTGLAEADVSKLRLCDLGVQEASQVFNLEVPVPIVVRRKKTKKLTVTFMGKESYEALKTSLKVRMQGSPELTIRRRHPGGKTQNVGLGPETLTLESPLFRSHGKLVMTYNHHGIKKLDSQSIGVLIRKAAITAGVWKNGFSAHALRRFFQTSLENAGVSRNWVSKMMGHKLEGSEESYSKPLMETLRQAYANSYGYLAVSEAVESRSRVELLEKQIEQLSVNGHSKKTEIETLKEESQLKDAKIDKQNERIGELEEYVRDSMETMKASLREIQKKKGSE
jgi:integrase